MHLKEKILTIIITKRYKKLTPLQIAEYFEKLPPEDKAEACAEILKNNNKLAIEKISLYMANELEPVLDNYMSMGSIPLTLVEELLE